MRSSSVSLLILARGGRTRRRACIRRELAFRLCLFLINLTHVCTVPSAYSHFLHPSPFNLCVDKIIHRTYSVRTYIRTSHTFYLVSLLHSLLTPRKLLDAAARRNSRRSTFKEKHPRYLTELTKNISTLDCSSHPGN